MKKFEVNIPEDICNYLEALMHESDARKDLIAFCMERGVSNTAMFDKYHREYVEFETQYRMAKDEMVAKFIAPEHPNCSWELDFNKCAAIVEE